MIHAINEAELVQLYQPVSEELKQVEFELKNLVQSLGFELSDDSLSGLYNTPDKFLRAALILLSAKAVKSHLSKETTSQLIQLAAIMEFVHQAIFIHNSILDSKTVHSSSNSLTNRVSILIGDVLYTQAFFTASISLPKNLCQRISKLTQNMCLAEIREEIDKEAWSSQEQYLEIIEEKTAIFFAACSEYAASLVSSDDAVNAQFGSYGLNLGMLYQLHADKLGKQEILPPSISPDKYKLFSSNAKNAVGFLEKTLYKERLLELIDFLIDSLM